MKRPTIKDVASLAKVSVGTVSKVINQSGNVSLDYQFRVERAIKELEYTPNAVARGLKSSQSKIIAVLIADLTNPFQMELAKGIEKIAYNNGYQMLISSTKENPKDEKKYLKMFYEQRVAGVILCSTGKANNEIKTLISKKIPVVLVDRPIFSIPIDIVADDNLIGMDLLVNYLHDQGHNEIAIINGDKNSIHGKLRTEAFVTAMNKRNLTINYEFQFDGTFSFNDGIAAVNKFKNLSKPPTAIISCNNNMTAGVLSECKRINIDIPNDLSVVSYGGLNYNWDLITPQVTFVSQSPIQVGQRAAKVILKRLHGSEEKELVHDFILPRIVERESVKKLNKY